MGSLGKILEKYHLEKWFQRDNLIILVLAGILLVVIALPTKSSNTSGEVNTVGKEEGLEAAKSSVSQKTGAAENAYASLYEYAEYLEEELEAALMEMSGVGKVRVMITLEASEELVVEKDEPLTRNNTTENDGEGGSRTVYEIDSGQETVYEKQGTNETPYVTKTILPKISGILIVAEGAGTGNISKSITEIAQALFGVEAHKIRVVPMG